MAFCHGYRSLFISMRTTVILQWNVNSRAIEPNGKKASMCFLRVCLLVARLILIERGWTSHWTRRNRCLSHGGRWTRQIGRWEEWGNRDDIFLSEDGSSGFHHVRRGVDRGFYERMRITESSRHGMQTSGMLAWHLTVVQWTENASIIVALLVITEQRKNSFFLLSRSLSLCSLSVLWQMEMSFHRARKENALKQC